MEAPDPHSYLRNLSERIRQFAEDVEMLSLVESKQMEDATRTDAWSRVAVNATSLCKHFEDLTTYHARRGMDVRYDDPTFQMYQTDWHATPAHQNAEWVLFCLYRMPEGADGKRYVVRPVECWTMDPPDEGSYDEYFPQRAHTFSRRSHRDKKLKELFAWYTGREMELATYLMIKADLED